MCSFPFLPRRTRFPRPDWPLKSRVVGVCQYPESFAVLGSPKGISSQHTPLRVIPERGKVSENIEKPPNRESCHVFHDCESRSYLANKTGELAP